MCVCARFDRIKCIFRHMSHQRIKFMMSDRYAQLVNKKKRIDTTTTTTEKLHSLKPQPSTFSNKEMIIKLVCFQRFFRWFHFTLLPKAEFKTNVLHCAIRLICFCHAFLTWSWCEQRAYSLIEFEIQSENIGPISTRPTTMDGADSEILAGVNNLLGKKLHPQCNRSLVGASN